ncbi:MAG: hypothetical protein WBN92_20690 [Terriglobia bacterium]
MPRVRMQQAGGAFIFIGGEGFNRYLSPAKEGFLSIFSAVPRAGARG